MGIRVFERTKHFEPVVIAPSYNNASTLLQVLNRVIALNLPLMVLNDGSTDRTGDLLKIWYQNQPRREHIHIFDHIHNRGKGQALRTAFARAEGLGFTHAVTIDTDGQLDPEQIPVLLSAASANPDALILGFRDDTAFDYPKMSRVGRRLSNFFIRVECGLYVGDSQCGFRVYPIRLVQNVTCGAGRYGYETEVIVRAVWAGCPIVEVPVRCRYFFGDENRRTHFKPWRDTFRHVSLHARMLARALLPMPHTRIVKKTAVIHHR